MLESDVGAVFFFGLKSRIVPLKVFVLGCHGNEGGRTIIAKPTKKQEEK